MRKLIYLLLASSTFIFGVATYFLWFYFIPVPVSLCELARHPDWYHGRIVRIAAPAEGAYPLLGITIFHAGCDVDDAGAFIEIDKSYTPKPEVQAFLHDSERRIRKADVVVIGRFDKNASMGCFGPKFGIVATNIELKSSVLEEPLPQREE